MAAADLFDQRHARKVLAAFGWAFGILPVDFSHISREQKQFLDQAVSGLAQGNKVICVRLTLFAEMVKDKTWTPLTLKEIGGTEGVGVTFLEETFGSHTTNPKLRLHQKAARAVLQDLLPESGTDIKGHMRSYDALLEACSYRERPKEFEDLIRILDNEIRLLTPTDPEEIEPAGQPLSPAGADRKYYQLTHDYLVKPLRDWLNRKQKETRRGRAEIRLSERSALWNAKPENRQLPALWEYLNIRLLTSVAAWTEPQKKMMRKSGQLLGIRSCIGLALLLVAIFAGFRIRSAVRRVSA